MIKIVYQCKGKKYERGKKNPSNEKYTQGIISNKHTSNEKIKLYLSKKWLACSDFFERSDVIIANFSIFVTTGILFALSHKFALPVNDRWLLSDPAIIGILNFLTMELLDHKLKITPWISFIAGVAYDFYPVFYSVKYDNCNDIITLLALAIGIPLFLLVLYAFLMFKQGFP